MYRVRSEEATEEEQARYKELRADRTEAILRAPEEKLYAVQEVDAEIPPMARIHDSITCDECEEPTMESRIQRLQERKLCPAYFQAALSH